MPIATSGKQKSHDEIGDLSGISVFHNQVVAAIYIRPEKTAGGIILTDNTRGEDIYQSKVGRIVKMGPQAFSDPTGKWFQAEEERCALGDWIYFRPSDGWHIEINGVLCRILDDTVVRGKVNTPERIW